LCMSKAIQLRSVETSDWGRDNEKEKGQLSKRIIEVKKKEGYKKTR